MSEVINIYCDESCHLENDKIGPMALGAVYTPRAKAREINKRIREIKKHHNLLNSEAKWVKISANHFQLYIDLLDYFFDTSDLHFRGVVIPDKKLLYHEGFSQTHDEWYYKMFFVLLKIIFSPANKYHIYLDYKDTQGHLRLSKLHDVLCNNYYDFDRRIIEKTQLIKSHQVQIMQITDLLVGALTYYYRSLDSNQGKLKIIERIKNRSGYSLDHNTLYREEKFNLLVWMPQRGEADD